MFESTRLRAGVLLLFALVLTTAIYWPGISGGFIYDDLAFIVENTYLQVSTSSWDAWIAAADSFPAAHQGRWLGMLSFAFNHYLHGLEPWGYKLTNLVIHLTNGCLIWLCMRALFALLREVRPELASAQSRHEWAAAMIATLWLVLPINLSAVLYVFQRVESLSNTFVLLGLWAYLRLRLRDWRGIDCSVRMVGMVLGAVALGVLVKESAVLLPLYIACVEFTISSGKRRDGNWSRGAGWTLLFCLVLPLLIGLVWLLSWVGGERSYVRTFDTTERLLTQARVLVQYVHWTLLPNLSELTLYHDDIAVSHGILKPWTTLPALLFVLLVPALALWKRGRVPIMSLGILWFFAGHALTATVIPLMLAFEHRNYFPSLGLLLALASLLGLEQHWLRPRLQAVVFGLMLLFYGATTHLRAMEWSNPLRLAASEAKKRPNSPNAQRSFALALLNGSGGDLRNPMVDHALALLEEKRSLPGAGIAFEQTILVIRATRGEAIDPELWNSMIETSRLQPPSASDVVALGALYGCMQAGVCPADYAQLRAVVDAALAHGSADANVFELQGMLIYDQTQDLAQALPSFENAIRRDPDNLQIRYNHVVTLIRAGAFTEARASIEQMSAKLTGKSNDTYLSDLRAILAQAERNAASSDQTE